MGAPDLLAQLSALGVRLSREGDALIAEPKSALTDEARAMIRSHKTELLAALEGPTKADLPAGEVLAEARKARALAYVEAHPNVRRACFADVKAHPENIVLTVALRDPWSTVEVLVSREKFHSFALMELSLRYPDTALTVPEH